jgi:stress-induced-phosphoprotein 1
VQDYGAKREIEKALDIDPQYVKAWARKGDIEIIMKENHKAMERYKKGQLLDPTSTSCKEGLIKVSQLIRAGLANNLVVHVHIDKVDQTICILLYTLFQLNT